MRLLMMELAEPQSWGSWRLEILARLGLLKPQYGGGLRSTVPPGSLCISEVGL